MEFVRSTPLPVLAQEAYQWHSRPGAFYRLNPPWDPVTVIEPPEGLEVGARAIVRAGIGPIRPRMRFEHTVCEPGSRFVDEQIQGPFRHWRHEHRFLPGTDPGTSILQDRLEVEGPLGRFGDRILRGKLERLFRYRQATTRQDLVQWQAFRAEPRKEIVISGGSGLVGRHLTAFLRAQGHQVVWLSRRDGPDRVQWDPERGRVPVALIARADVVLHLAGENLLGRWTRAKRKAIRDSRVTTTALLARTLADVGRKDQVFICASGANAYGHRLKEPVDESASRGEGFLADVCADWEGAADPARQAGIRTVFLRTGVVLSAAGGALNLMLPAFQAGLGGPLGDGKQRFAWIAIDDLVAAVQHILFHRELEGPVNAVAPESPPQREFARQLGRVLHRPAILPVPAIGLRLVLGQMAEETLLADLPVRPKKLLESGYGFTYGSLKPALAHLLGRAAPDA
ncbi:MAG: TIGR01777 family oxidoreductase [Opitutales bacterium]